MISRIAPLAAVVPALALAGFGGASVGHAATASCASDVQRVEAGAPGPLDCSTQGVKTLVVARRTALVLTSMRVTVQKMRTAHTLSEKIGGATVGHATAKGLFVVVTVRVSNVLSL